MSNERFRYKSKSYKKMLTILSTQGNKKMKPENHSNPVKYGTT